jgi:hypothetical protein
MQPQRLAPHHTNNKTSPKRTYYRRPLELLPAPELALALEQEPVLQLSPSTEPI